LQAQIDQTIEPSMMTRSGTLDERAAAICGVLVLNSRHTHARVGLTGYRAAGAELAQRLAQDRKTSCGAMLRELSA